VVADSIVTASAAGITTDGIRRVVMAVSRGAFNEDSERTGERS
jgi:hypothetical protein